MAKGMSLHVGLNSVDPKHYQGWSGDLQACEADASDMAEIATRSQYGDVKKLLTKQATRDAVKTAIKRAAKDLVSGDLLLLTYSGHGGQLPDQNDEEPDR